MLPLAPHSNGTGSSSATMQVVLELASTHSQFLLDENIENGKATIDFTLHSYYQSAARRRIRGEFALARDGGLFGVLGPRGAHPRHMFQSIKETPARNHLIAALEDAGMSASDGTAFGVAAATAHRVVV